MPLTKKGKKVKRAMKKQYGEEKGEQVFYASQNKGVVTGTHKKGHGSPEFGSFWDKRAKL